MAKMKMNIMIIMMRMMKKLVILALGPIIPLTKFFPAIPKMMNASLELDL